MNYKNFSLLVGSIGWLVATLIFRFAGQYFFIIDNPYVMIGLYIETVPHSWTTRKLGFQRNID